jgi:hypothetical protein
MTAAEQKRPEGMEGERDGKTVKSKRAENTTVQEVLKGVEARSIIVLTEMRGELY